MKDFAKKEIAERVKELRKEKSLTQAEFALKIQCDRRTIINIESGKVGLSSMVCLAICNVFGVRKDWLLQGEGEKYDNRWVLLEARAKELGEDIALELASLKARAGEYDGLIRKIQKREEPGGLSPLERVYVNRLLDIFRTKDQGTVSAITQNIDTFLRVPAEKLPPFIQGEGEGREKKKA